MNEWFSVDEAPEDLLVFVTGSGVFDITGTWTEIKESVDDYALSAPLLLCSSVPRKMGEFALGGDDELLQALGFAQVQESRDPVRRITVTDAHSGKTLASGVGVSGNLAVGALHPEVDLALESSMGVTVTWNDTQKKFAFSKGDEAFTVHLAGRDTVLQVGANQGGDMGGLLGDMSARGLGFLPPPPLVVTRELAGRTLTRVDGALDRRSRQAARLGAYQNRLEHAVNGLTVQSFNLAAAESRIRDLDMAREMLRFTRANVLVQAGTALLTQANQLPESVLQLLK